MLSPSLGRLAALAADYREAVDRLVPRGVSRRIFWRRFFSGDVASAVDAHDVAAARRAANVLLSTSGKAEGKIWLVAPVRAPKTF